MTRIGSMAADGDTARRRRRRPLARLALRVAGSLTVMALFFLGGFAVFALAVSHSGVPKDPHADAIVVLTGDIDRIDGGLKLLAEGRGSRLLISGVNPVVDRNALAASIARDKRPFLQCCIDLDHARDTIGNASETGRWADLMGYESLIVVTSDYHMPRSLAEMAEAMPDKTLVPYPVSEPEEGIAQRLQRPGSLRLLFHEYVKYLAARVRLLIGPSGVDLQVAGAPR